MLFMRQSESLRSMKMGFVDFIFIHLFLIQTFFSIDSNKKKVR